MVSCLKVRMGSSRVLEGTLQVDRNGRDQSISARRVAFVFDNVELICTA